jgi:uncharacterized protein YndB with AHSA1/START domain
MTSRVLVALRIAAPQERVFTAFTAETGQWWRPHGLFALGERRDGLLAIEPGPGGRVTERYPDGGELDIGRVRVWEPPVRLVLSWRAASFPPDRETEVHVRFEDVEGGTRVVVEHLGWDALPPEHAARHGFPLLPFQQRLADWWQTLLADLADRAQVSPDPPA